jgi:hypothetical protein
LKQLIDGIAVGIKFSTKKLANFQCDVCVLDKVHKTLIYNNPRPRVEKVGQMFHTDVCGPMSIPSSMATGGYVLWWIMYQGYYFYST